MEPVRTTSVRVMLSTIKYGVIAMVAVSHTSVFVMEGFIAIMEQEVLIKGLSFKSMLYPTMQFPGIIGNATLLLQNNRSSCI